MKMVCIKKDTWVNSLTSEEWPKGFGPKFNEVVTIEGQCPDWPDSWMIKEYPTVPSGRLASFKKRHFAPLGDISELTEILQSEPITEKV